MSTLSNTELSAIGGRHGPTRWRSAGYFLATVLVVAELGLGGIWDIARTPDVRDVVAHLGYPSYFLVLLGSWKLLGAVALLVPRRALLKEWAYVGIFFTYTGAIVSHLTTRYALGEIWVLGVLTALTALSWGLRPPSRRATSPTSTPPQAAAIPDAQDVGHRTAAIGHQARRHPSTRDDAFPPNVLEPRGTQSAQ